MMIRNDETLDDLLVGGLQVIQSRHGYRFSLDAVLLADFAALKGGERVCDLGTGSGVISILLAWRKKTCQITALEIQESLCNRAMRSVRLNQMEDRIQVLRGDIRKLDEILPPAGFDLAVANPPFWPAGQGRLPVHEEAAVARHELELTLSQLLAGAAYILKPKGRLALVHRAARLDEIVQLAGEHGLGVQRLRTVHPYRQRSANLVLVEAVKEGRTGIEILPPLVIYNDDGQYTSELLEIYGVQAKAGY
ncbi:MAG: tRNA1(Val) (adenine(37)-N6)-methyltransferase [Syntrophomonadaceae bacterium]|jgi:tRNA1Val (adenine37-N6)-methyltransferase|nr:tRNA1(Val) (adenine(37)-N6)-methyltransferase [Syntrophomonadaceae bacterium]